MTGDWASSASIDDTTFEMVWFSASGNADVYYGSADGLVTSIDGGVRLNFPAGNTHDGTAPDPSYYYTGFQHKLCVQPRPQCLNFKIVTGNDLWERFRILRHESEAHPSFPEINSVRPSTCPKLPC